MLKNKVLITLCCSWIASFSLADDFSEHVDENGAISLPNDFRKDMAHLGSWFVPQGEASGFHDVYTDKKTIQAYRKSGQFPDAAIIVKELRASTAGTYTTGKGVSYANETVKQVFVMIKDSQNRFPDNQIWGEGWGWALFKPDDSSLNVATNFATDCLGCHIPAKSTDWVYIEAYPSLMIP